MRLIYPVSMQCRSKEDKQPESKAYGTHLDTLQSLKTCCGNYVVSELF